MEESAKISLIIYTTFIIDLTIIAKRSLEKK